MSAGGAPDPLGQATAALRQHTDAGWTRIRADVVTSALAAFRPSTPVRGVHAGGEFFLAGDVLVARVRSRVDSLREAAAAKITATTSDTHDLQRLMVRVVAAYGSPLVALAEQVRQVAASEVAALLGTPRALDLVHVDVHIGDVTDQVWLL